jgi:uncharacterized protein involved in tellurium resistance
MAQFQRTYKLTITDSTSGRQFVIDSLRINFSIKAGVHKSPNTSHVKIYNLNDDTRKSIHLALGSIMTLDAGYEGTSTATIFKGDIKKAYSTYKDVDWETCLEAGDGENLIQNHRTNISVAPNTSWSQAVKMVATKSGIPVGNLVTAMSTIIAPGGDPILNRGYTDNSITIDALNKLLEVKGWSASIQNGTWLFLGPTSTAPGVMIVLDSTSGLIGFPENSTKLFKGGPTTLKVTCLLNNLIHPGTAIQINDPQYQGQTYRVDSLEHEGDNIEGSWLTKMLCRKVS